jgi:hypothetical protein
VDVISLLEQSYDQTAKPAPEERGALVAHHDSI